MADEKWGEQVTASVVLAPGSLLTEQTILDHCRGHVASYKVPKRIDFRPALSRTTSGKVLRRVLRDEARRVNASSGDSTPQG